ncbi:MAG: agmatine deiminase family protein [Gemmatimonadaceae bacterium]|nr:agmatine deiminase family protein [Gemmatimonadaceae bacterium]
MSPRPAKPGRKRRGASRAAIAPQHPVGAVRWPAEWEPHDATWIAWPHHEPDWPGKFGPIPWVYAEIARVLSRHERVEILCQSTSVRSQARRILDAHGVPRRRTRLHRCPTDRVWLRDSAPTGIHDATGAVQWVDWGFTGWAKYRNHSRDARVGAFVARASGLGRRTPLRHDTGSHAVLEGGGIETDGRGTMLVTEEWLLSRKQVRNRGFGRDDYERLFAAHLGIRRTIWLGEGCVGDDTHGHIDDIARFAAPGLVLLAHERDTADPNHRRSVENLRRLRLARDAHGHGLAIWTLPFPRAVTMNGQRLPASYANFYVANGVVIVPTFNDPADREALETIARAFPRREVVGIHAVDLVWGLGTLHCLTQQQPAARR